MSEANDAPALAGANHLALSVTNLDKSLAFYRDVLGAETVWGPKPGGRPPFSGRTALVRLGGQLGLDLYEHDTNAGEQFDPARTGLDHLGLVASSLEDLHGWRDRLEEHGVACSPIRETHNIVTLFDFVDPDGIQLEFTYVDRDEVLVIPDVEDVTAPT